jgi:choline monooxygenase
VPGPGSATTISARSILAIPTRPDHTIEKTYLLVHPDSRTGPDLDGALDRLADFWHLVNREDVDIVERIQEGLKNRAYGSGRMCYGLGEPIHRFQNMVIDRSCWLVTTPCLTAAPA